MTFGFSPIAGRLAISDAWSDVTAAVPSSSHFYPVAPALPDDHEMVHAFDQDSATDVDDVQWRPQAHYFPPDILAASEAGAMLGVRVTSADDGV